MPASLNSQIEFQGKTALVVGGSSGIGLSAAILLAQRGAKVAILADRGVDEALAIASGKGVELLGISGDASVSSVIQDAVEKTIRQLGGLHITVHSAVIHPYGSATTTSEGTWDRVMAVNLKGVFLLAHHVLPHMVKQKEGAIVNVSSIQGSACQRDVCAYSTSKAAILALTRSIAVDYSIHGIRANSVSPGSIRTPLLDLSAAKFGNGKSKEEMFELWGQGVPAGRIGEADEIAELIAFAASSRASYCSGSEFTADGGLSVRLN